MCLLGPFLAGEQHLMAAGLFDKMDAQSKHISAPAKCLSAAHFELMLQQTIHAVCYEKYDKRAVAADHQRYSRPA